VTPAAPPDVAWQEQNQTRTVAVNVTGRYVTLAVELLLGLVMLPFNTRYLGASDYGLWILAASIVAYFPVLDLGYTGAMERFVAHYRARRDPAAINEIASTLVFIFAAIGLVAFAAATGLASQLGALFNLTPQQAYTGGVVLVLVAVQFSVGLPFAVFGAVVNGFQRTILNSAVGTAVALAVAVVNVAVLLAGGGLIELVGAMTAVRLLGYVVYRLNAYRVFPVLRIRLSLFRKARLREVTGFSVYMLIQDLANRINYMTDPVIIAAVMTTGAVAVWTIAQRLADIVLRLTNQLNETLFPVVVDCDSAQRDDRLRELLVQGTRLSLATALPMVGTLAILAEPVVIGWTGPAFRTAAPVLQILAMVVLIRVATSTAATVLRGAGHHQLLATSNFAAAIANIVLSIVLIRTHGLPGMAVATLIPVSVRAAAVLVPVACARVKISLGHFAIQALWPALWPAMLLLGGFAAVVRESPATSLAHAAAYGAAVALLYSVLFLTIAISREDRTLYMGKLRSIVGRPALTVA
jgi:O-antigen/teichoic acid export membrane protein